VAIDWDGESRVCTPRSSARREWLVVDDGLSSNGTFVNGQRIAAAAAWSTEIRSGSARP